MFLGALLLIFLVLPAVLILAAIWTPLMLRFWILFAAFPLGLIAFALWRSRCKPEPGGRR